MTIAATADAHNRQATATRPVGPLAKSATWEGPSQKPPFVGTTDIVVDGVFGLLGGAALGTASGALAHLKFKSSMHAAVGIGAAVTVAGIAIGAVIGAFVGAADGRKLPQQPLPTHADGIPLQSAVAKLPKGPSDRASGNDPLTGKVVATVHTSTDGAAASANVTAGKREGLAAGYATLDDALKARPVAHDSVVVRSDDGRFRLLDASMPNVSGQATSMTGAPANVAAVGVGLRDVYGAWDARYAPDTVFTRGADGDLHKQTPAQAKADTPRDPDMPGFDDASLTFEDQTNFTDQDRTVGSYLIAPQYPHYGGSNTTLNSDVADLAQVTIQHRSDGLNVGYPNQPQRPWGFTTEASAIDAARQTTGDQAVVEHKDGTFEVEDIVQGFTSGAANEKAGYDGSPYTNVRSLGLRAAKGAGDVKMLELNGADYVQQNGWWVTPPST
jgi:hypothetical protein